MEGNAACALAARTLLAWAVTVGMDAEVISGEEVSMRAREESV